MLEQLLLGVSVICLAELKKRQYGRKCVLIFSAILLVVFPVCLRPLLQGLGAVNSLF